MTIRGFLSVPTRGLSFAVSGCQSALNYLIEKIKNAVSWFFSLFGISVFRPSTVVVMYDPHASALDGGRRVVKDEHKAKEELIVKDEHKAKEELRAFLADL